MDFRTTHLQLRFARRAQSTLVNNRCLTINRIPLGTDPPIPALDQPRISCSNQSDIRDAWMAINAVTPKEAERWPRDVSHPRLTAVAVSLAVIDKLLQEQKYYRFRSRSFGINLATSSRLSTGRVNRPSRHFATVPGRNSRSSDRRWPHSVDMSGLEVAGPRRHSNTDKFHFHI